MSHDLDHALLQRVNLNHLITFLAVADAHSFRGAASVLHVSQSALSVQIRQLEDALGTPVFDRTTRSVKLTATGERILPVARQLANDVTSLVRTLREEANLQKHAVRLATMPFAAHVLPAPIKTFCDLHKDLEIQLAVKETSRTVASMVTEGEADLGIIYMQTPHPGVTFTEIFRDEFLAVVPAEQIGLSELAHISLKELAAYEFLIQPPGSIVRDVLDTHFKAQGLTPHIKIELRPADALVALVSAGLGVAVLPQGTARFLNLTGCHLIRLEDVTPRPLGLALPALKTSSAATVALHEFLARHLGPALDMKP